MTLLCKTLGVTIPEHQPPHVTLKSPNSKANEKLPWRTVVDDELLSHTKATLKQEIKRKKENGENKTNMFDGVKLQEKEKTEIKHEDIDKTVCVSDNSTEKSGHSDILKEDTVLTSTKLEGKKQLQISKNGICEKSDFNDGLKEKSDSSSAEGTESKKPKLEFE